MRNELGLRGLGRPEERNSHKQQSASLQTCRGRDLKFPVGRRGFGPQTAKYGQSGRFDLRMALAWVSSRPFYLLEVCCPFCDLNIMS
jgi:hypothetical protein